MIERDRAPAVKSDPSPVGFLGWGSASAVLNRLLLAAHGGAARPLRVFLPVRAAAPPAGVRIVASVEALLAEPGVVIVDLSSTDWRAVLPALRLAISDRNVLVLAGHGISIGAALKQLHERKIVRCVVTPHREPEEAILAFHPARWVSAQDAAAFRSMFGHIAHVLELREEAQFDVVRALSGIAPAVLYTLADALADGALMMGLPRAQALSFLSGVMLGAARAMTGAEHPAVLRDTALEAEPAAAGLMELESAGARGLMMRVVDQAVRQVRRGDRAESAPDED